MLLRKIFIIVPAAVMDSPVKGAAALANALSQWIPVTFVTLKEGYIGFDLLNANVDRVSLYEAGSWLNRLRKLRKILLNEGGRDSVACISFCLSADFFNSWCKDVTLTCTSVRGNLPKVYPGTYGRMGKWIAYRHLNRLKKLDYVVSMTHSMSEIVEHQIGKMSPIIGNFVDESQLDKYRRNKVSEGAYQFIYTGSLIKGKQPGLLIEAVGKLLDRGINVYLNLFGEGPLLNTLKEQASKLKDPESIKFHGFILEPFESVAMADALVLPSLTEGVSRSALEALYLGVPCVMRDVDGNSELITKDVNGELFNDEVDLADAMLRTAILSRSEQLFKKVLIPEMFRQHTAAKKYLDLLK